MSEQIPKHNDNISELWRAIKTEKVQIAHLDPERVLVHFDAAVGFGSSFLMIELGVTNIQNVLENPKPCLYALLCFFHIMVYWLNIHHFLRFQKTDMNPGQVWAIVGICLGLVLSRLSLARDISVGLGLFHHKERKAIFICISEDTGWGIGKVGHGNCRPF